MMKIKFIIAIGTIVLLSNVLVSCSQESHSPIYIAHAGGQIDGYNYTNCMEAVQHSLSHNITHIELDLVLTSDSQLVAAHDWNHYNDITGHEGDSLIPSYEEFKSRKMYGRYTPITWEDIDTLMNNHPYLYLVTDKISSPKIINQYFGTYRERVLVECFNMEDYIELERLGYFCMLSSPPPTKVEVLEYKNNKLPDINKYPIVPNYTFWYFGAFDEETKTSYEECYGETFAVFSVANKMKADRLASLDPRIKYVYVDSVE